MALKNLSEQVSCDDDALDLVRALVDLGVLGEPTSRLPEPVPLRTYVHEVHWTQR